MSNRTKLSNLAWHLHNAVQHYTARVPPFNGEPDFLVSIEAAYDDLQEAIDALPSPDPESGDGAVVSTNAETNRTQQ